MLSILMVLPAFSIEENYQNAYSNTNLLKKCAKQKAVEETAMHIYTYCLGNKTMKAA